ncbi:bacteriohemerythrin [Inmirania thermothiophila]|uniref:Hemerythrin n=1 Tax=Inmirania thermothiophila TaxID=1750597 RepID=A0A3N1Y1G7_9GAMM|nr:bacteriohemerythrin [Inmirania thermothiophila]ROR32368.1 hemerythrin [Inmirania thermothiophila]
MTGEDGHWIWDPALDTGIAEIDAQHRRIVDYINELGDAIGAGDGAAIAATLHDLVDYTLTHFSFEERLMARARYPAFEEHRALHEHFQQEVRDWRERFQRGEDVAAEVRAELRTWLLRHIQVEDHKYAPWVRASLEQGQIEKGWLAKTLDRLFGEGA